MTDTATLIAQLRVLAHLTRTEAQVARLRTTQATGDDARHELQRNAADADARATRIGGALRDLGALPDPVTPALGGAAALFRGALEQAQPLDEALFGDLALEHQLRDRARHVGALADAAGLPALRALADDLVAAHTETLEWIHGVLDDVAAGRRAALAASPLQRVAAQVTRTANAPARPALDEAGATVSRAVGRTVDTVTQAGGAARAAVGETAQRAARAGADAAGTATATAATAGGAALAAGRDAAVQAAAAGQDTAAQAVAIGQDTAAQAVAAGRDAVAHAAGSLSRLAGSPNGSAPDATGQDATGQDETGQDDTAQDDTAQDDTAQDETPQDETPQDAATGQDADAGQDDRTAEDDAAAPDEGTPQADAGSPDPDVAPIPGFAELSAQAAIASLRTLDRAAAAAALAFEQAHGNRSAVLAAARIRAGTVRDA